MSQSSTELRFRLDLSTRQYLAYYQGRAAAVRAVSLDGRRVQFPANILKPHVRHDGVHGLFALRIDAHHRVLELRRIAD